MSCHPTSNADATRELIMATSFDPPPTEPPSSLSLLRRGVLSPLFFVIRRFPLAIMIHRVDRRSLPSLSPLDAVVNHRGDFTIPEKQAFLIGGHRIFSRSAPSHATAVSSPSPTAGGHLHSTTAAGRTPSPSFFYSHRSQGILPLPLSLLSVRDVLCVRSISSSRGLGFATDSTGDFIPPSSEFEQQHLLQIWSAQHTSIPALLPSSGPDLASHSSTFSSTAVFKFDQQFFNRSGQLLFLKPNLGQEKDPMAGIMDLMKVIYLSSMLLYWPLSCLVKILKKYDKRTGALIRQPFFENVLQQPFFTTDLLYKLVKECVAMLDHLFPSNNLSISAECDGQSGVPKPAQSGGRVPEMEEIKYMQSLYMKSTVAALRSLKQIRSKSSTVKTD
ncbi:hypothetical protein ZIOFF_068184 [Zingiber officinale]|uniref:SPX domain-containing protein n=1 Tax=Zingiber officinale TaxID=94328 RepID=A0A8J5EEI1_ZINOF|nr:hypothetical protein ZIOFF_068184 [Zingiber officinale]